MSVLSFTVDVAGQIGVQPRRVKIISTDNLATVTTAGYLNNQSLVPALMPTDFVDMVYGYSETTLTGTQGVFIPSVAVDGSITLSTFIGQSVQLPVNVGDLAVFVSTNGTIGAYASSISDYQEFVGLTNILLQTAGTWSTVRGGAGDYARTKTPAADTSITGFDITPSIRTAASKGFRLDSIDVAFAVATLALVSHTATLSRVTYVNGSATSSTNVPLTGTIPTAVSTNITVANLAVTTPAYLNSAISKYVFELTVNAAATSSYALCGLNLHFTKTTS